MFRFADRAWHPGTAVSDRAEICRGNGDSCDEPCPCGQPETDGRAERDGKNLVSKRERGEDAVRESRTAAAGGTFDLWLPAREKYSGRY